MAKFDLPSTIDYVLSQTNRTSLAYVGHSQGTKMMFALLSIVPKYNAIVKPFIALSPVAFIGNIKSPVRYLAYVSLPKTTDIVCSMSHFKI